MPSSLSRLSVCALALGLLSPLGCTSYQPKHDGQSLLKKPRLAPESVVLEVFSVHFRRDDCDLYRAIWQEVDEQALPVELRRRLIDNGLRAGLVSSHLPQAVQRILELNSQPTPERDPDAQQVNVVKFDGRPTIRVQQMQLPARRRGEIAASGVYASAAPLLYDDGQVRGETFEQCQGMIALKAVPQDDGRVQMEFVPELHHGESQRRFSSSEGVLNLETGRPRKALTNLTQELTMSPGDLYVIGSSQAKPGSLGDYFFTVDEGTLPHAKLVFVRLAHTQNNGLFSPRSAPAASEEQTADAAKPEDRPTEGAVP